MSQPGGTQPLNAHFQQQQQPLLCNDQLAMVTAGSYGYQPYKYGEYPMASHPQLRPAQGGYETGYGMVGNVYASANKKYMLSPPIANQHFEKQAQGMLIAGASPQQQVHTLGGYQQPSPAYISAALPQQRIMGYVNQQSPRMMGYMNQVGYSAAAAIVQQPQLQPPPPQMYNVQKQAMYQSYVGSGQSQWIIDGGAGVPQPMAVGFATDGGMVNQTYNMTVYAQQEPSRVYQSDVNVAHRQLVIPNNLHSPAVVMNNMAARQPFPQQPYQQESQQFCVQQPDGAFSPCANVVAASPVYRGSVMQGGDGSTYDGRQQCISTMAGPTRPNTVACLTTCVSSVSASQPSTQQCLYSNLQYGAPNTVDNRATIHYSLPPQGAYGNETGGGNVPKISPGLCEQNMSSAVMLSVVSNSVVTQSSMQRAVATTTTFTLPTNQTPSSGHVGGGMSCCQGNHHMGAIGADGQTFTALRQSLPRYKCPNSGLTADQVAVGPRNTVPLSHMNQWNSVDSPCGATGIADSPGNSISVPFGWKRVIEGGIVVYYSPSQARITSPNQMCQYLLMDGTCKCGLECPLLLDRVFHFDPSRPSKPWSPADIKYADDVTKLCSHKRKIIAMATFQNTTSMQKLHRQNETQPAAQITPQKRLGRKLKSSGRKRRKKTPAVTSPYDGMFVSQLLSCRDKLLEKTLPPLNTPQDSLMPTPELEALLSETTMKKSIASPRTSGEHRPANKDSMCEDTHGSTEVQSEARSRLKGSAFMQTNLGNPFVMECDRNVSQKFVGFGAPQQHQRAPLPGCEKFGQAPVAFAPPVRMNSVVPHGYRYAAPCQQAEQYAGDVNAMYAVRQPNAMMSGHVTTAQPIVMNSAVLRPEPPDGAVTGQRFMMRTLRPPGGLSYQQADFNNQRGLGGPHGFHQRGPYWPYMRRKATEKDCQQRSYNSVFSGRAPCPNVDVRQMCLSQNMAGRVSGASDMFHNNASTPSAVSPHVSGHESSDLHKALHSPVDDEPTTQDKKSAVDVTQVASMDPLAVVSPPKCTESHPPGSNIVMSSPLIKRERCGSSIQHTDASPDTSSADSPGSHTREVSPIVARHPGFRPCDGDTDSGAMNKGSTADSNSNTCSTNVDTHSNNGSVAVHSQPVISSCDFPASSLLSAAARGQLAGHSVVSTITVDRQSVASEMQQQLPPRVNRSQLPVSSVESSSVPQSHPSLSVQAPSTQTPSVQAPSVQAPSVQSLQAPSVQAPSAQSLQAPSVQAPSVRAPSVQFLQESPTTVPPSAVSQMQSDDTSVVNGDLPEQSPIQMVQNMISGLEATQNQLAMVAMCKKTTSRRRRSAFSADLCCPVGLPEGMMHRYCGGPDFAGDNIMPSTGEFVDASMYTAIVPTGAVGSSGMPPLSVGTVTAVTNAITQLIPSTQPLMPHQEQVGVMKPGMLQEMHAGTEAHLGLLMGLAQQVVNQQVVVPQQPSLDQVIGQQVMMGQSPMMHVVNGIGAPVVNPVMMINQLGGSGDSAHPVMLASVTPMVMAGYNELPQDVTKVTEVVALDRPLSEQITHGHMSDDPQCEDTASGDGLTDATVSEHKRGHRSKKLARRKGKRKDRCKKSSTPTIASMLQAANSPAVVALQQQQLVQLAAAAAPTQPMHLSLPMIPTQLLQQTAANFGPGLVNDIQLGQLLTAQQLQLGGMPAIACSDAVQPMDCGATLQNFTMPNVELLMKQLSATAQNPMASAQILQSWAQNLQGQNTLLLKNLQSLQQQHQELLSGTSATGDVTTANPSTYRYNGDTIQARNPVLASALAQGVCGTPTIDSASSGTSSGHQVESPDQDGVADRSQSVTACNSDEDAPSCIDPAYSGSVDSTCSEGKTIAAEDHNSDTSDAELSARVGAIAGEAVSASPTDGGFAMNSIPNPMNLTAAVSAVMNGQQLDAYPCETVATVNSRSRPVRHIRTNRFRAHGRAIRRRHRLDMHNSGLLRKRSFASSNNNSVKVNHESNICDEASGVTQAQTALDLTMPSGGGSSSCTVTNDHDAMRTCDSTETAVLTKPSESVSLNVLDSPHVQTQRLSTDDSFSTSLREGTCMSDTAENVEGSFSGDDHRNAESCRHDKGTEMLHSYHQETVESLESAPEENMETSAGCHDDNVWATNSSCQEDDSGISASCQGDRLDGCHDNNNGSAQDAREKAHSEVLDGPPSENVSAFSASSTDVSNGCYDDDSDQDEPINLSNDRTTTTVAVDVSSTQTHEAESSPWKDTDGTSVAGDDGYEIAGTPSATAPSSGYDDSSDECPIADWRNNFHAGDGPPRGVIKENGDSRLDDVYAESTKVDTAYVSREAKLLMIDRQTEYPSPATENEDDTVDACSSPRTFNTGDLVWGPIRGYSSWPGKIVHDSEVRGHHESEDGKLWVRWFGDHTFTQVEPAKLKTLSEGLDAQHRETKKHRKGRRMNSTLESAIQEAMMELDKPDSDVSVSPILNHMTITSVTTSISCASTEAASIVKTGKTKIGKKQKCR